MGEQRRIMETKLPVEEAYKKILKRTSQYGYSISSNVPNQLLEVKIKNKTPVWWVCVILGFICYIIPGILILLLWKPEEYCKITFDKQEDGNTEIIALIKGEKALEFFNSMVGLLL